jgi:hypothetical protein
MSNKGRQKSVSNYISFTKKNILKYVYFILTIIYIIYQFKTGQFSVKYGLGQALTAQKAFSPLSKLLNMRIMLISAYYIIKINKSKKEVFIPIIIELIISLMTGGRKNFIIILFSYLISNNEKIKFNYRKIFNYLFLFAFVLFLMFFISNYRKNKGSSDTFFNKVGSTLTEMNTSFSFMFFNGLNSANSEGVQNWTYQLVDNGKLELLYGKSYLQAVTNTLILRPLQGEMANWQAAYYFKNVAYPNVTNQGWDYTFTAEAILNWGKYFAFLSYVFLAVFIAFFYNRKNSSAFYKVLYFQTWPILFICMRTDSTSLLRYYSYFIVFYLVFRFFKIFKKIQIYENPN